MNREFQQTVLDYYYANARDGLITQTNERFHLTN